MDPPSTRNRNAPSSFSLGTMSWMSAKASAIGVSTIPAARFWMPLPIQRLPFGASSLNRMVPATMEVSETSVSRMPCRLSVPTDMRCQTIAATPATPSSNPKALRQVSVSLRKITATTAVNTGLLDMIRLLRPADIDVSPV